MVGLPWVRLDTGFMRNPKMLALLSERDGYHAAYAWLCSLAYCGEQGSDGYIPAAALGLVFARPREAELLTKYRFWHDVPGGGWQVNDWAEYQESSAETQQRSQSARRAACIRWHQPGCDCWAAMHPAMLNGSDPQSGTQYTNERTD